MVQGLVMIPSLAVIVEMIQDGVLTSLPVNHFHAVDSGDVICFHDDAATGGDDNAPWVYVLVQEIEEWVPFRQSAPDAENTLVKFKVIDDLSSFVIA